MEPNQAQALVALTQAYFPALRLPESTVSVWAGELEALSFSVGSEAVRLVARNGTGGRPLQLADILTAAESLRERVKVPELTGRNELHDLTEGLDDESQAILDEFFDNIGGRPA